MAIYICGDIHGDIDIHKLNINNWPEQKDLSKDDLLIILGDFGLVFELNETRFEQYWLKWLLNKKCTVLFIDGNHENFDRINNDYPEAKVYGATCHVIKTIDNNSLYHIKRGEVLTYNNKKILCIGGATSVDKNQRVVGISWWQDELLSYKEEGYIIDNIIDNDYYFDYILTHTAPMTITPNERHIISDCPVRKFLQHVSEITRFKEWHFGHFHTDTQVENYHSHYNNKPLKIIS